MPIQPKEETAVHASFLKDDYERAIELISDVTFNSSFPDKEIEKEKDVVIEEINSYLDNPADLIFDDFEELIFARPVNRKEHSRHTGIRQVIFQGEACPASLPEITAPTRWFSVLSGTYPMRRS